ncbi:MAG: Bifunctional protein FolD protein [Chlamydiae bacterium]|nr:Bifunctional protein FolD protein [Chlamydiota bacterium]
MLLEGTKIRDQIKAGCVKTISGFARPPNLTAILVGENAASKRYLKHKQKACFDVGIESHIVLLPQETTQDALEKKINELNDNPLVDGILLQLPLPINLNALKAIETIDPTKDVDGLHPINFGYLVQGSDLGFIPCTPLGIQTLLKSYDITVEQKHVVICGRSNIVGKPLANLFLQKNHLANATVTCVHSQTKNIANLCKLADILVVAIGRPKFVTKEFVKKGACVIDVGINEIEGKLVGDVDFENVKTIASSISPVPKGVGPMTIAMLLTNTIKAYQNRVL